jgi:hypothetical protein
MSRSHTVLATLMILAVALSASTVGAQGASRQAASPQTALGSAFTYQGRLTGAGGPVTATCSMEFSLYDAPDSANPVAGPLSQNVSVAQGLFSASLDFGAGAFNGSARWLGIVVTCPGDSGPTPLTPRQPINPAPYAAYALSAGTVAWSGLTGVPAGLSDGDNDTTYSAAPGGGLTLGGTAFSVDTNIVQARVTGACAVGSSVRSIAADGSVTCLAYSGRLAVPAANSLTTVDSAGAVGNAALITLGADGLPVISYVDVTNTDLKVAHCGNAACSSGNTLTTVDSTGDVGGTPSITLGTDGLPVISYYDYTNGDLKVARCSNAACSSGNWLVTVDSTGDVGLYTSIMLGADGLPVISYYDYTNGDLKVAHCGNATCNSNNILTTVDTNGDVGYFTSITLGADGLPVISYQESTNGDLKVAHCGNDPCNVDNTLTMVDSVGQAGYSTSITLGADGLPVIAYHEFTNGDLKVVHCGNAACSIDISPTTVDSAGQVGYFASITLGADGLPVISYFDSTNADLKVAHCSNAFCVPYIRRR